MLTIDKIDVGTSPVRLLKTEWRILATFTTKSEGVYVGTAAVINVAKGILVPPGTAITLIIEPKETIYAVSDYTDGDLYFSYSRILDAATAEILRIK